MRILTRSEVEKVILMGEAVAVVEEAFRQLSTGEAQVPQRLSLWQAAYCNNLLVMPAYLPGSDALGIKLASLNSNNVARGLPLLQGVSLVFDPATGTPVALMDAAWMTALRTGAASGVASRWLARQNATTVTIFGAGVQARTQLLGVCAVRPIKVAWICDVVPERARSMIADMQSKLPEVEMRIPATPKMAVRHSQIICTATTSVEPIVFGHDLQPGTHINSIGSYSPKKREVDSTVLTRAAKIVVDSRLLAWEEAGDLLIPLAEAAIGRDAVHAEIGEIVAGKEPGRESEDEITFFKSVGNAVQDVAVSAAISRRAIEQGLGADVNLSA